MREFKEHRKDVLVATDVASKGLDFTDIQHVINYDMPTDIENYGTYRMGSGHHAWGVVCNSCNKIVSRKLLHHCWKLGNKVVIMRYM